MATANDLMGLGVPAEVARHASIGGTGPLTIVVASTHTSYSAATKIRRGQFFVSVATNTGLTSGGIGLPAVGGDTGALLTDQFVITNRASDSFVVFAPVGTTIAVGGSATSYTNVLSASGVILYPVTSTAWVGIKGEVD